MTCCVHAWGADDENAHRYLARIAIRYTSGDSATIASLALTLLAPNLMSYCNYTQFLKVGIFSMSPLAGMQELLHGLHGRLCIMQSLRLFPGIARHAPLHITALHAHQTMVQVAALMDLGGLLKPRVLGLIVHVFILVPVILQIIGVCCWAEALLLMTRTAVL